MGEGIHCEVLDELQRVEAADRLLERGARVWIMFNFGSRRITYSRCFTDYSLPVAPVFADFSLVVVSVFLLFLLVLFRPCGIPAFSCDGLSGLAPALPAANSFWTPSRDFFFTCDK